MTSTAFEALGLGPAQQEKSSQSAAPTRRSRRIAMDLLAMCEILAVVAGGVVPALLYSLVDGARIDWLRHIEICIVAGAIVFFCLKNHGMHDVSKIHRLPIGPARLLASLSLALFCIAGLGLPFAPKEMSIPVWYGAWLLMSYTLLLDVRYGFRELFARLTRTGAFDERVAVYGNGTIARRVNDYLADPAIGVRFAGLYDDRHDAKRVDVGGPALAGRLDDLVRAARAGEVDRIVIALPQGADQRTAQIAARLEHLPVSLHVVTHIIGDLVDEAAAHAVSSLGSVGLLDVKRKPMSDWARVVKAAEDRILGPVLLVLAAPLLAVIAFAVRLDSPGPVLFRQSRKGLNQKVIEVLKFRTMHVLENGSDLKQATKDDPRITRVGRFLRRWSLDELPQLINVVRGDMSLVGPRPHAVAHDDQFGGLLARYANRHQVKPGITGLAQISGLRGATETSEKMERRLAADLEYVETWSLWLDLKILALTFLRGWCGRNAY